MGLEPMFGNTGHEAVMYFGWDTSPFHYTMHKHSQIGTIWHNESTYMYVFEVGGN